MLDEHLASFEEDGRRVAFVHLLSDGRYPIDVLKLDEVRGFRGYGAARDEDKSPRSCCELQTLYLDRFVWRHGYGAVMTQRVLDYARTHSFSEVVLWVLEGNARARSFYEAMGFAPDGARKTL